MNIPQALRERSHAIKITLVTLGTWTASRGFALGHPWWALVVVVLTAALIADVWIKAPSDNGTGEEGDWRRVAKRYDLVIFPVGFLIITGLGI